MRCCDKRRKEQRSNEATVHSACRAPATKGLGLGSTVEERHHSLSRWGRLVHLPFCTPVSRHELYDCGRLMRSNIQFQVIVTFVMRNRRPLTMLHRKQIPQTFTRSACHDSDSNSANGTKGNTDDERQQRELCRPNRRCRLLMWTRSPSFGRVYEASCLVWSMQVIR